MSRILQTLSNTFVLFKFPQIESIRQRIIVSTRQQFLQLASEQWVI